MRFRFIEDRRADYPVTIMCGVLWRCNMSRRANTGSDKPYSITSSARARSEGGTARPSVLAVLIAPADIRSVA